MKKLFILFVTVFAMFTLVACQEEETTEGVTD
jgi:hypothetical protein